ncbi:AAA family ATPase [Streptomyces sp. HUCO-GS316]|uniref:helix-turn-helix transcriptional regulator n=1 Tax=Streptomyces sp. HUCO-GS316 TaxID=2692198 RepID=UPI00136B411F|nr:LuxR family transcriptional regulator [Streptomyces sp. HUCO-GS316]MXM64594.1 AAA family ATPase [Streptomyces sp. HUCO-GS316]
MTYGTEHSIIGRQAERRQLAAWIEACRSARKGGALLLTGDQGIGKTTLIRHTTHLAQAFHTVRVDGVPAEQSLDYAAVQRLVRPLAVGVRRLPPHLAELLERLLLGLLPPPRDRSLTAVAVLALLARSSVRRPVLVSVDDLQWVDAESRQVLGLVARRISAERVLVLAAADHEAARLMPGVAVLHLTGMSDRDCLRLIAQRHPSAVAPAVGEVLVHAAGGNPLVLLEFLRTLSPSQLAELPRLPDPLPLGPRLTRLSLAPLRGLSDDCRRLLTLLATEPRLDPPMLHRVAHMAAIDPAALTGAEAAGLVTVSRTSVSIRDAALARAIRHSPDLTQRHWAHELLARVFAARDDDRGGWHEAALSTEADAVLADELERQAARARRHGRPCHAAVLMERSAELTGEDGQRAGRLVAAATCSTMAGRLRRAAHLLERAEALDGADHPSLRGDIAFLQGVLSLHQGTPDDAYHALLTAADVLADGNAPLAAKALAAAGEAGLCTGNEELPVRAALRARALLGGSMTLDEPDAQLATDCLLGVADSLRGLPTATVRLRTSVAQAAQAQDPLVLTWAAHGALFIADDAHARSLAARAVALARRAGDTPAVAHAMQYLAYSECWLSGPDSARLVATEALRLARGTGQIVGVRNLMGMLMLAAGLAGDTETCEQYADRVVDEAAEHGNGLACALGLWGLAQVDLASGRWEEAAAKLRRLTRMKPGHPGVALQAMPAYVEAAVRAGLRLRAERAAAAFARWADGVGQGWPTALVAQCRAVLAHGDPEEHFRLALRLHGPRDRALEQARTALLYGEYLKRERRRAESRVQLREAAEIFRRHRARLWLDRACAELRASGDNATAGTADITLPADSALTDSLTARQREIIRLVAAGATNKEAAARLCLSPRTVDYHLRRVFQQLHITSRAELIRRFGAEAVRSR